MKPLSVGVIGLGVGMAHAETYSTLPDCSLTTVCDFDETKLREASDRFSGIKVAQSAIEICSSPDIDIVSVASYDADHAEQVVTALRHGKHVFVEKPLCTTTRHATEIRQELITHPSLILGSNLVLRRSPRFSQLKALIQDGSIGTIFSIETGYHYGRLEKLTNGWRGEDPHYSPVLGGGIHVVDLICWLLEDRVARVSAVGNRIASAGSKSKCNDFSAALLTFKSGAVATLTVNFGCVYPHFHPLRLYGTKATYINGLQAAELWRSREADAVPELLTPAYPGVGKGDLIPAFIDAVCGRSSFEISPSEMFHALDVCFAIDEATQAGSTVSITSGHSYGVSA
jgi:predicted dehydrogenase